MAVLFVIRHPYLALQQPFAVRTESPLNAMAHAGGMTVQSCERYDAEKQKCGNNRAVATEHCGHSTIIA